MQLLTDEMRQVMPKYSATESVPLAEKLVVAKFFYPMGAATWLVLEGEPVLDDAGKEVDFEFWGWACLTGDPMDADWGTFRLSELASFRGRLGLGIERDLCVIPLQKRVREIHGYLGQ